MYRKLPINLPSHLIPKLVELHIDSGDLERSLQFFNQINSPDLLLWTKLITIYAKKGFVKESIQIYRELRKKTIVPDKFVLLPVIKSCSILLDLDEAESIHSDVIKFGFSSDIVLGNALIDMYGKCRSHGCAKKVFDEMSHRDVISWTCIGLGFLNSGYLKESLRVFNQMILDQIRPNSITVSALLPACSSLRSLKSGKEIHGFVIRNGIDDNMYVNSALVNMYANFLSILQARIIFDKMPKRDGVSWNVILTAYFSNGEWEKALELFNRMKFENVRMNSASWNSMIRGCVQNKQVYQALQLLSEMQRRSFKPNKITIATVLPICANLESLRRGKDIHGYSYRHGFVDDIVIATSLIFMWAKCGKLEIANRIFDNMKGKDTVAWNTMILANSIHGHGKETLFLFNEMIRSGFKPNPITFIGVLSGCSHSRLVNEGRKIFDSMSMNYGITPDRDHYSCMVDILSRSGHLYEAYKFIQKMPLQPTAGAWGALLGACRVYKDVKLGRIAANHLFEIEPNNPGNYVIWSNILVCAGLWEEAANVRRLMRDKGINKIPGRSWIQVKNITYTFVSGDQKNAQRHEIYAYLHLLREKMKAEGHLPSTNFALEDVDQEKKEMLCGHSEKLAVVYGILNLKGSSNIIVFKNLRICEDCHNVIKFMAKTVGIQITVRDSLRFHHFQDGFCSCQDFW